LETVNSDAMIQLSIDW